MSDTQCMCIAATTSKRCLKSRKNGSKYCGTHTGRGKCHADAIIYDGSSTDAAASGSSRMGQSRPLTAAVPFVYTSPAPPAVSSGRAAAVPFVYTSPAPPAVSSGRAASGRAATGRAATGSAPGFSEHTKADKEFLTERAEKFNKTSPLKYYYGIKMKQGVAVPKQHAEPGDSRLQEIYESTKDTQKIPFTTLATMSIDEIRTLTDYIVDKSLD